MRKIQLRNAEIISQGRIVKTGLFILDGKFSVPFPDADEIIDLHEAQVIPGLMDIHTHGAVSIDFNRIREDEFERIMQFYCHQGVTSLLPTILSDSLDTMLQQVHLIAAMMERYPQIKGIHLEGPFLAHAYKGAMPEQYLCLPDTAMLQALQTAANGAIRLITIAPELPGSQELIQTAVALGITVSIGHSNATYAEATDAVQAGVRGATHTFNAMRLFHQHEAAIMGAVLMHEDVFCEAICDYHHLVKDTFNFLVRIKGMQRINLITDSIMAAGLGDGDYWLGVNEVTVADGDAVIKGTNIRAGSILTGIQAVRNAAHCLSCSMLEAAQMMTSNPARYLGLSGIGTLEAGADADFIVLDGEEIHSIYCAGKRI